MREALGLFLPFLARQVGLASLGAKVFTDTPASAHLLEAQGFSRMGVEEVHSAGASPSRPSGATAAPQKPLLLLKCKNIPGGRGVPRRGRAPTPLEDLRAPAY